MWAAGARVPPTTMVTTVTVRTRGCHQRLRHWPCATSVAGTNFSPSARPGATTRPPAEARSSFCRRLQACRTDHRACTPLQERTQISVLSPDTGRWWSTRRPDTQRRSRRQVAKRARTPPNSWTNSVAPALISSARHHPARQASTAATDFVPASRPVPRAARGSAPRRDLRRRDRHPDVAR